MRPGRIVVATAVAMMVSAACGQGAKPPRRDAASGGATGTPRDAAVAGSDTAPAAGHDAGPAGTADAAPVAAAPDCDAVLGPLEAAERTIFYAKDISHALRAVHDGWPAVPAACRTGRWYLIAARLLDERPSDELVAPGVALPTRHAALTAALAQTPEVAVLAFVAYAAALGSGPPLPADACDTALRLAATAAGDRDLRRAHYVCGQVARAAGDTARAADYFADLGSDPDLPDLDLRRAELALARGDRAGARRFAARALADEPVVRGPASTAERAAIVAAAKAVQAKAR